jgi:hypothetical protein
MGDVKLHRYVFQAMGGPCRIQWANEHEHAEHETMIEIRRVWYLNAILEQDHLSQPCSRRGS